MSPALIDLSRLPSKPAAGRVLVPSDLLEQIVVNLNALLSAKGAGIEFAVGAGGVEILTDAAQSSAKGSSPKARRQARQLDTLGGEQTNAAARPTVTLVLDEKDPLFITQVTLSATTAVTVTFSINGVDIPELTDITLAADTKVHTNAESAFMERGDSLEMTTTGAVSGTVISFSIERQAV